MHTHSYTSYTLSYSSLIAYFLFNLKPHHITSHHITSHHYSLNIPFNYTGNYPAISTVNGTATSFQSLNQLHLHHQNQERARTEQQHVLTIHRLQSEILTNSANASLAMEKMKLSLKVRFFDRLKVNL